MPASSSTMDKYVIVSIKSSLPYKIVPSDRPMIQYFWSKLMATIKLRNVSFNYATPIRKSGLRLFESPQESNEEDLAVESSNGVKALDSVSLTIPNGQTFVIVGPS